MLKEMWFWEIILSALELVDTGNDFDCFSFPFLDVGSWIMGERIFADAHLCNGISAVDNDLYVC